MRLSTKYIAAAVMAVALPIASMSAPAAGAQPTSEKQATQQSQISQPRIRETRMLYNARPRSSKKQKMQRATKRLSCLKLLTQRLTKMLFLSKDNPSTRNPQSSSNFLTDHSLSLRHLTAQQKAALSLQPYQLMAKQNRSTKSASRKKAPHQVI